MNTRYEGMIECWLKIEERSDSKKLSGRVLGRAGRLSGLKCVAFIIINFV